MLNNVLLAISILSSGVVYGTDVFFAVVGRPAAAASSDAAVANVMANIHKVADARMPIFGGLGILSTLALAVVNPIGTPTSWLALIALVSLLTQLSLYLLVDKPVNQKMKKALQLGEVPSDIRHLQNRWDSVIVGRAVSMALVLLCLTMASILS